MQDPLKKIQQTFPGRKISVTTARPCPDDFCARRSLTIDGRKIRGRWNFDDAIQIKQMHNVNIEDLVSDALVEDIANEIDTLPKLSKWRKLKNQIDYLRKRKNRGRNSNP